MQKFIFFIKTHLQKLFSGLNETYLIISEYCQQAVFPENAIFSFLQLRLFNDPKAKSQKLLF